MPRDKPEISRSCWSCLCCRKSGFIVLFPENQVRQAANNDILFIVLLNCLVLFNNFHIMHHFLTVLFYLLINILLLLILALMAKGFFTRRMRFRFKAISLIWVVIRALYYTFYLIVWNILICVLGILCWNEFMYLKHFEIHWEFWVKISLVVVI